MSAGRIVAVVLGALLALLALASLTGGIGLLWADGQRDADGFIVAPSVGLAADGFAVTSEDIDLRADPRDADAWVPNIGDVTVRVEATAGSDAPEMFLGIGPEAQVAAYLADVPHTEVREFTGRDRVVYRLADGSNEPGPPRDQSFWSAQSEGDGTQTLVWDLEAGQWTFVLMNADGSRGVAADVVAAADVPFLVPLGATLLVLGIVGLGIATLIIVLASTRRGAAAAAAVDARPGTYPVRLEGHLDAGVSRWQWLVKWLLVLPHVIALTVLWVAFAVLTMVAGFSILFTRRYPRAIFDFNVGVLRWTWRVAYYSYGALGTDRYPPFTLRPAGYPAEFDVAYPETLSRGLVLIKWWLLAIPHYLIVGVLIGNLVSWTFGDGAAGDPQLVIGGGLIGVLVFIAGIVLLVTGNYPGGLFDLVVGLNRWVFRVGAYAALMRDEYPPFRLDLGGSEPPPVEPEGPTGGPGGVQRVQPEAVRG